MGTGRQAPLKVHKILAWNVSENLFRLYGFSCSFILTSILAIFTVHLWLFFIIPIRNEKQKLFMVFSSTKLRSFWRLKFLRHKRTEWLLFPFHRLSLLSTLRWCELFFVSWFIFRSLCENCDKDSFQSPNERLSCHTFDPVQKFPYGRWRRINLTNFPWHVSGRKGFCCRIDSILSQWYGGKFIAVSLHNLFNKTFYKHFGARVDCWPSRRRNQPKLKFLASFLFM